MGRRPERSSSSSSSSKEGLRRGPWTAHEDEILVSYVSTHGIGKWGALPKRAGLKRCGKSCRLRWLNYLRPGIKRGNISSEEEELIIRLHNLLGNRWSLIAGRLPGRTDNEIKNYWNTTLMKRLPAPGSPPSPPPAPPVAGLSLIQTEELNCAAALLDQDGCDVPPFFAPEESDDTWDKEKESFGAEGSDLHLGDFFDGDLFETWSVDDDLQQQACMQVPSFWLLS